MSESACNIMNVDKIILGISADSTRAHKLSIEELEAVLQKASDAYYNTGSPIVSDELFDSLKDLLQLRDPENDFLLNIGAPVKGALAANKAKLPFPMFSLDKIKPETGELEKFEKRYDGAYVLSDKLDGASCMIVYRRQRSSFETRLYRRGTGLIGADISHLARYLLPAELRSKPPGGIQGDLIAIRGEVIMSRKDFEGFRTDFKDARGLVNGVINRKTPDEKTLKHTSFVAYEIVYPRLAKTDQMRVLDRSGYQVVAWISRGRISEGDLISFYEMRRKTSPFAIDGIVVEDDGPHSSSASSNPDFAFAFKMRLTEQAASVRVIEVFWEISKDGRLVPRVQYEPVEINGVVLKFATGYKRKIYSG